MTEMIREDCWRCCRCGRDAISPRTWGACPGCTHRACGSCGSYRSQRPGWGDTVAATTRTDDTAFWMYPSAPETVYHIRAPRRLLQLFLANILTSDVCADTGSAINCISSSYLKRFKAKVRKQCCSFEFHLPVKGKRIRSAGYTEIHCCFPVEPCMPRTWGFYVFETLACDVIVGRDFLRETRTLDLYQNRLHQIEYRAGNKAFIRSISDSKEHIWCYLDGHLLSAVPDTGAEINLISWECVQSLGYAFDFGWQAINQEVVPTELTFADSSSAVTLGTVELAVSFSATSATSTSVHRLVDATDLAPSEALEAITERLAHIGPIYDTFYVVDGLRDDVVLGECLLTTLDAYTRHSANFLTTTSTKPAIAPFWVKKKGEPKAASPPTLTAQEQFRDRFNLEHDRCERERESIGNQRQFLQIDEEETKRELARVTQQHLLWVTENRTSLDRYNPGYYEQVVAQDQPMSIQAGMASEALQPGIYHEPDLALHVTDNIHYPDFTENPWT